MPDEIRPSLVRQLVSTACRRGALWATAASATWLLAAAAGYAMTPGESAAHAAGGIDTAPSVHWSPQQSQDGTQIARFIEEAAKPSATPTATETATAVPPTATLTPMPPASAAPPRQARHPDAPPPAPATNTPLPAGMPWGLDTSPMDPYSRALFDDTNRRRVESGLPALRANGYLVGIARIRSQDMADHNYFAHVSPITGDTAFSLMDKHDVPYGWAGENLAKNNYPDNETVSVADESLWNSPPHRENILNPNYTDAGIALVFDATGMKYFTIVFIGPP